LAAIPPLRCHEAATSSCESYSSAAKGE